MEAISAHFEALLSQAEDYAETRARLLKLKIADTTAEAVSDAVSVIVVWIFSLFFLLCLSIGAALLLGDWLGKSYYGFFIIAGIYGIAGIIIYANRGSIVKAPVSNFIIGKILKKTA